MVSMLGAFLGGIIAIYVLSRILEWTIFKRITDSAVQGKLFSVIVAYAVAVTLYALGSGSAGPAMLLYLPGAALWLIHAQIRGSRLEREQPASLENQQLDDTFS